MASIIRIKRSTGTIAPATINYGELAYTTGVGTFGNNGGRLFVGDLSQNPLTIGGRYYTDLLAIGPGLVAGQTNPTTAANGFVAILDQNRKVDQWNVDNLRLDGNTLSSTDTNGNIYLTPDGNGEVIILNDDYLTFGTAQSSKIKYNNSTSTTEISGADWNFLGNLNVTIGGNLVSNGNVTLGNSSTDNIIITGITTINGAIVNNGGILIDSIGISSNTISTKSGSGNVLYIDPYPDGFSNQGKVVIKGDLQVDGTTTSVNSTSVTVNEPILNLGDVNSVRTVMSTVQTGVSTVTLDSVVGINTGDLISGSSSLPSGGITTVTAYNATTNIVTFTGTTSAGISTATQLTIQHNYDTNTDRGISFEYNTSVGAANSKKGFFGYIDGSNANSSAPVRSWTYIPDATVTNSVATGTRGYLDVKGIYYQTGDFSTHGIVYFDSTGIQTSTTAPSSATITSTQLLTAVTEITITLASSQSVTQGDQITQQNNSGAYGMVKTTSSGTTITLIGVQGTFDTTNNLVVNGTSISKIPSTVTTVYTSRPTWTTTLDGGTF